MKAKKEIVAFTIIITALVIAIGFTMVSVLGNKTKEIKVAKELVGKLQKMDIIDTEFNIDEIEFKSVAKVVNKNSKTQYTVVVENIGIDLDSKYVVTGFSHKSKDGKSYKSIIEESEAIKIAEKYVDEITNEKFTFKEVRAPKEGEENNNIYTIAFYKYYKDYPYYDNEIVVNINKLSGKLENYTNPNIDMNEHNSSKEINSKEAKNIAIEHFNKLNVEVEVIEEPLLAFVFGTNEEFELCYVINLETLNSENESDKYKLFINSESGLIINRTNDLIDSSRSN
ncbi:MAG: hypothetical protein RSD13_05855 [Clostridium sp.]